MDSAVALRTAGSQRLPGRALRVLKDEKLATMVAAGSDDAFATLYQRHHQAVYGYCRALLGQEADARDALQSSMLAALSSLRAKPIEGAFKPWLFQIAHNQSISIIRGRARESPTEAPPEAATSDDAETREELRTLVSDLDALPERQRGAIVMRELSGLTYVEIAAALATSEAGGKQLVYEARTAMQELREGHEMSCDLVRERISAGDRRLLRGRKVRSHLRGCEPCRDFERGIGRRRAAFAALAPPLPAFAAAAVLQDVFGAGGGSGGAGGAGAAAAGGAASGGASLAGTTALKFTAAAVLAGAAGVGAYEAASAIFGAPPAATSSAMIEDGAPSVQGADHAARGGESGHAARATSGDGAGRSASTKDAAGSGGSNAAGGEAAKPGSAPSAATSPGSDSSSGTDSPDGSSPGGGGPSPPPDPPPPPPDPPPPPGGGSGAAPGTPPGHGGTAPSEGGTPPGQVGGATPPGHLGNPGQGGHP